MPGSATRHTRRRHRWAILASLPLLNLIARWYRLVVKGEEHLPPDGAALLLVKHRATCDSLLLSQLLHRTTGRMANYLMKYRAAGLPPQVLEIFGGIPVIRPKDILRLKTRAQRRAHLQQARLLHQQAMDYVEWLYVHGELVVTYPEGTFYPDQLGPLYTNTIHQVYNLTRDRGLTIPIVPIGTVYQHQRGLRPQAFFRIGPPLDTAAFSNPASLVNALRDHLHTLSALDEH